MIHVSVPPRRICFMEIQSAVNYHTWPVAWIFAHFVVTSHCFKPEEVVLRSYKSDTTGLKFIASM